MKRKMLKGFLIVFMALALVTWLTAAWSFWFFYRLIKDTRGLYDDAKNHAGRLFRRVYKIEVPTQERRGTKRRTS